MAYEMKDNSGSLWVNDRNDKDEHPDRAVSIMVEGGEDWINGWLRKTKDGSRAVAVGEAEGGGLWPEARTGRRRAFLASLLDNDISLDRAYYAINAARRRGRAATSEVEALEFSLRKGVEALMAPDAKRRLADLSEDQLREVCTQLLNFKPNIAPLWSPEEVEALVIIWSEL